MSDFKNIMYKGVFYMEIKKLIINLRILMKDYGKDFPVSEVIKMGCLK
jgi:hypothetical protein